MLERLIRDDPGLVRLERGFGPGVRGCTVLPQVSNTMDQAWLTLTQARDVLTQARNALVEARYAAYEAWSRMGAGG